MNLSSRIVRGIALAARLDILASLTIAAALLIWMAWH
jgi:hypothetical protein